MKPKFVNVAPMVAVESSQLAAVGYDQITGTLQVQFNNKPDTCYQYHAVTPDVFDDFIAQQRKRDAGDKKASVGHVFYGQVKDKFAFTRFERDGEGWKETKSTWVHPEAEQAAA
jgi:hypothetical protein